MIKFGPSGNCQTFYDDGYKKTIDAPKWLKEQGLNHFEYSFGRGITLSDETAFAIGSEMKKYGISISVHAPYFINFASDNALIVENSFKYVFESLRKLKILGGNRLVVHLGSVGKFSREDAINLTKTRLYELSKILSNSEYSKMYICLETMGKISQIGTYKEILDFCTISNQFIPTFDFGHINAITQGSLKTYKDYKEIIDNSILVIGLQKTKIAHIHFSKIQYSKKGEVKHLTLEDNIYGPEFEPLSKVLKEIDFNGIIISESKNYQARDAKILKEIYFNL